MADRHFVYIIKCGDDTLYTGYTTDLSDRLEKHAAGKGAKYTRGRGPLELIYSEEFTSKEEALKREWAIKQLSREEKIQLIEGNGGKGMDKGTLYLCATPIGNLEDITYRVLRTLREVDLIAAEDTRHTRKLLTHFDIHKQLTSYHEHNKTEKGKLIIEKLLKGSNVALVSDAGTPGISDPGEDLVKLAIENEIPVYSLPGPSAFVVALTVSGLPTDLFAFYGFLPIEKKFRRQRLKEIAAESKTIILYEAPHKLKNTLEDLYKEIGDREIIITRELTKKFEEVKRSNLKEMLQYYKENNPKGEYCLVIRGEKKPAEQESEENAIPLEMHVEQFIKQGLTKKDAIKEVARLRGLPKRDVYNSYLKVGEDDK